MAVVLAGTAQWLPPLFNGEEGVVAIATRYLYVVPLSYGTAGIIQVASSALNALGRPVPAVIMTAIRMFVLYIPLAYLGSIALGPMGIFCAATVSNLLVGAGAYWWSRRTCFGKPTLAQAQ